MYFRHVAAAIAVGVFLNSGAGGDAKFEDAKRIQGTWKVIAMKGAWGDLPPEEVEKTRFKFTADQISQLVGEREEGPARYKLDPTKKPKTIDLMVEIKETVKGKKDETVVKLTLPGIYHLDESDLKICLALDVGTKKNKDGKLEKTPPLARPTEFKASDSTGLLILKRVQ